MLCLEFGVSFVVDRKYMTKDDKIESAYTQRT
jgi:hypothetical protein